MEGSHLSAILFLLSLCNHVTIVLLWRACITVKTEPVPLVKEVNISSAKWYHYLLLLRQPGMVSGDETAQRHFPFFINRRGARRHRNAFMGNHMLFENAGSGIKFTKSTHTKAGLFKTCEARRLESTSGFLMLDSLPPVTCFFPYYLSLAAAIHCTFPTISLLFGSLPALIGHMSAPTKKVSSIMQNRLGFYPSKNHSYEKC